MSGEQAEREFPAVEHLRDELRANLLQTISSAL